MRLLFFVISIGLNLFTLAWFHCLSGFSRQALTVQMRLTHGSDVNQRLAIRLVAIEIIVVDEIYHIVTGQLTFSIKLGLVRALNLLARCIEQTPIFALTAPDASPGLPPRTPPLPKASTELEKKATYCRYRVFSSYKDHRIKY